MLCKTCFGCYKKEQHGFEEVLECIDYQSLRDELEKRIEEVEENIENFR